MSTFNDLRHRAPKEPDWTCPHVDAAIDTVNDAIKTLEGLLDHRGELEKLRDMNAKLRECADYWKEKAEEVADELDDAKERIADLESDLQSYERDAA